MTEPLSRELAKRIRWFDLGNATHTGINWDGLPKNETSEGVPSPPWMLAYEPHMISARNRWWEDNTTDGKPMWWNDANPDVGSLFHSCSKDSRPSCRNGSTMFTSPGPSLANMSALCRIPKTLLLRCPRCSLRWLSPRSRPHAQQENPCKPHTGWIGS